MSLFGYLRCCSRQSDSAHLDFNDAVFISAGKWLQFFPTKTLRQRLWTKLQGIQPHEFRDPWNTLFCSRWQV